MTLTRLKIAVLTPIPRASTATAAMVNPGDFQSWRNAKRKSWIIGQRLEVRRFCLSLVTFFSFRPQSLHWIDPRGAHRRDETGECCDAANEERDAAIEPGIARIHLEKEPLHQPRDR